MSPLCGEYFILSRNCVRQAQTGEEATIQAARARDLEAFNTLVLMYQDRVYQLAYRVLGDQASAADAAQEAFILAYLHINRFHAGSFFAWLYRIVTNVCYDAIRYHKRRPALSISHFSGEDDDELELDLPAAEDSPETIAQRYELAALLQQHIYALPADLRMVLVLSDVQGGKMQENEIPMVLMDISTIRRVAHVF